MNSAVVGYSAGGGGCWLLAPRWRCHSVRRAASAASYAAASAAAASGGTSTPVTRSGSAAASPHATGATLQG